MKLLSQNKKRIVGAVCRHIVGSYGKYNKDLPVLKSAVEQTINDLINHKDPFLTIEAIIHYNPERFRRSGFLEKISDRVYSEYSKQIKEKHAYLRKSAKPRSHFRVPIRSRPK